MTQAQVLSIGSRPAAGEPASITFYTDILVSEIVEVAELPRRVTPETYVPGRGMPWAEIGDTLIQKRGTIKSTTRTTLSREQVRELMRSSTDGWISVPMTEKESAG